MDNYILHKVLLRKSKLTSAINDIERAIHSLELDLACMSNPNEKNVDRYYKLIEGELDVIDELVEGIPYYTDLIRSAINKNI